MKNTKDMLDVKELKRKKLEELKLLCKNLGLKYSGNKPVLLGRLIAYYTSGSTEGANKRSVDDLYGVFQDYLGTKRKKSAHVQELERDKTKSKYNYAIKGERTDFRKYVELVFGLTEVTPSVNFIGESLRPEYDTQTKEQFTSALTACQHKLLAAAFSAHRYFTEDLIPSMHFPYLAILVIRETEITDMGIQSLLYECPKLRVLDIALTQIRGEGLCDLSTKCPLLESIEIYHPLDLAIGLPHITKCSLIHTLAGVECYDFDDDIISMLVNMPNLVNCRVTYSLFERPSKITSKGIALLRKKVGFERIDFPADLLLDSISDPETENETTATTTTATTNLNTSSSPPVSSTSSSSVPPYVSSPLPPSSSAENIVVKTSPPPSPPLASSQTSIVTSDIMPQFQVRKAILAPKEIRVFDPVGEVSLHTFRRALRLIPALTALDLCAPTCHVEKVDSAVLLLADSPYVSRITRLGLAQQAELTDTAIHALRSFTSLRELNLSFCVTHHQYSQLYPQHLLQPAASVGWGNLPTLAPHSTTSTSTSSSTSSTSTSSSAPPSTPIPPSPSPTPPSPSQANLQQILLQRIGHSKPSPSHPHSPSPSLSPSPSPSSFATSPSPLTTQQLLHQRLQQRIQQRSGMESSIAENAAHAHETGNFTISKIGNSESEHPNLQNVASTTRPYEPVKTDGPKAEIPAPDTLKSEKAKTGSPKTGSPKTEEPKIVETKTEEAKTEEAKTEEQQKAPEPSGSSVTSPDTQASSETKKGDAVLPTTPGPSSETVDSPQSKEKGKEDVVMSENEQDTSATSPPAPATPITSSPPTTEAQTTTEPVTTTSSTLAAPLTPTVTPSTPSSFAPPPPPPFQQPLITAEAILASSVGWPNLETLYLDGIPFAPRMINQILVNCKNLRTVSLNACGNTLDNVLNGMISNPEFQEFQRIGLRILHTKKK